MIIPRSITKRASEFARTDVLPNIYGVLAISTADLAAGYSLIWRSWKFLTEVKTITSRCAMGVIFHSGNAVTERC